MVEKVERPVAFVSSVLNLAQRNYCPTRRELLAVVAALQHFRHYLLGANVVLQTDHLKWLRTFKRPEGILARWIETLAEFNYKVEHRPGRLHCSADAVSRPFCKQVLINLDTSHGWMNCKGLIPLQNHGPCKQLIFCPKYRMMNCVNYKMMTHQ